MRNVNSSASKRKWRSMKTRCFEGMPNSKKVARLRFKLRRQKLKLQGRRSSKNSRVRKSVDVLRANILRTSETSYICKNLRSKLVFGNEKKLKSAKRSSKIYSLLRLTKSVLKKKD
jgi:hypothetical protein